MRPYKLLPLLLTIFLSCDENNEQNKSVAIGKVGTPLISDTSEAFDTFNQRFHEDSKFQISRIDFPIGGRFADGENSYNWTVKNWQFLKEAVKETVDTEEYEHNFERTDTTVTEKYWIENSGFKIERRFRKIGGKWFLTYYDDINL
ncbi:hypothetical protein ACFSQD_16925 [Flavihumibacter stibioxidans]|uniref:DUF4348 domain-containing protein n=1 Tax=Flavihumibacter stibioxidans TaxID=1834163 RepID=A0ABR7M6K6_9BACT|nr:hypothetical protein [Flavihumibacter stibioxidans]MBC6490668.1 hypothetical protein [Flavihumibacter stibioxidans]